MELSKLEELTLQWSHKRGILTNGTIPIQTLKLMSEAGELCDNVAKGKDTKDDIGDCLVVLTNIAYMSGTTLAECWEVAYNDIKDRKGFLNEAGTFIKTTDKSYEQLKMDYDTPKGFPITEIQVQDLPSEFSGNLQYLFNVMTSDHIVTKMVAEIPGILSLEYQNIIEHSFIGKDIATFRSFISNELKGDLK